MAKQTSARDIDDLQLGELCRQGDREARRELYERTSERIYGLLLKYTRDPDQAFDLTQETYVRAFTRMHQFDGRCSPATWLYRIAVNEAMQLMRRTAVARANLRVVQPRAPKESEEADVATKMDVEAALAALPVEDQAILLLRYQDGLDYATIAEVTGCPLGTVGSRLNRARHRLRDLLADYAACKEPGRGSSPAAGPHGLKAVALEETPRLEHPTKGGQGEPPKTAGQLLRDAGGR